MSLSLKESLSHPSWPKGLSPEQLHETNRRIRSEMASADWRMAVCLLASVRQNTHNYLKYSSITEYAAKALQLHPQKTGELLSTARALESLPALSEAFRTAQIGWGKMRELKRVATPETEEQWLGFALTHTTDELRKKISVSPREWKRSQALTASLQGTPAAAPATVARLLEDQPVEPPQPTVTPVTMEEPPELPGPKTIRLVFNLTPDQYAAYEQAESRVRARANKRLPREAVLTQLAETALDQGTARARGLTGNLATGGFSVRPRGPDIRFLSIPTRNQTRPGMRPSAECYR